MKHNLIILVTIGAGMAGGAVAGGIGALVAGGAVYGIYKLMSGSRSER